MPRKKTATNDVMLDWGFVSPRDRTPEQFAAYAKATKLRTLRDLSEHEIRELERVSGLPVIRPERLRRARRATGSSERRSSRA
jgi:hypothetical protein